MIRRNPTLIQMNDNDVQDIRDMVAQQKAEIATRAADMVKLKNMANHSEALLKEDMDFMASLKVALDRVQDNKDREARLGINGACCT